MRASTEHMMRSLDFTAVTGDRDLALRRAILRYVHGLRGHRTNGLRASEVCGYLRATPEGAVRAALAALVASGHVRVQGGYHFFVQEIAGA